MQRAAMWAWAALALLAVAAARRLEQDFEFDDDKEPLTEAGAAPTHSRRPRRYIYDPANSLCQSLVCKKREVCLLRDSFTALCANKKDILRKGDTIVPVVASSRPEGSDDDVFYEGGASTDSTRCVGCGPGTAGGTGDFLCGSDNRTYSSLCRLDLHNCVRRGTGVRAVKPVCHGFCPCRRDRDRTRSKGRPKLRQEQREWRRRKAEVEQNEVLPERTQRRRTGQAETEECALDKMASRLVDWFSVLMEDAAAIRAPTQGFPRDCKAEVRWMFSHLDTDGDGLLSDDNLYALKHDERERCLRPFLSSCDGGGAGATAAGVSRAAWCRCLRRGARPCAAQARALPARLRGPGQYAPACDARGYYRPRQCHAATGACWCVDPHGVELPGTRTRGAAACPGEETQNQIGEGAPSDDEDAPAGSGDGDGEGDLRF